MTIPRRTQRALPDPALFDKLSRSEGGEPHASREISGQLRYASAGTAICSVQLTVGTQPRQPFMSTPTTASLAAAGTTSAVHRSLEEQLFDLVYRQMRALVGGREREFDDLVQDAMEQALRSLPAFERRSKLSTWTYQICYRTVLKRRRWYGRWLKRFTLTHEGNLPDTPSATPAPGHPIENAQRSERLWRALSQLSGKKRVVVVLHDMEGLASEEIAEVIGVKLGTVRSRLRDGRKELLAVLKDDPFFGEEVAE